MSIRHHNIDGEEDETELLASPDDVARYVRPRSPLADPEDIYADEFDDDTVPSAEDVVRHLEGASAKFERRTQQSWRSNRVVDETHDHKGLYYWLSGHPIDLMKREIRPLDPEKGDKLEVYMGGWNDWLEGNYAEGRHNGDYWLDAPIGILWIYERAILRPHPKFRITYRYGFDHVPHDIREAVAKRAAADIVSGDFGGVIVPGNNQGENSDPLAAADRWIDDFRDTVRDYKRLGWV